MARQDPKEVAAVESKSLAASHSNNTPDAFLSKQKELDMLKKRAMEKDEEMSALESTLNQRGEERKTEIEILKKDLGHERQAWMTTEKE